MKNVMMNFKEYSLYFGMFFLALGFTSCSDDDDGVIDQETEATGTITASDQTLSGNTLVIEDVTVGQDSWIIVRNSNDQSMAADPYHVEDDEDGEVRIELNEDANLMGDTDGDDFDVYLYSDNPNTGQGTWGEYDEGIDEPITNTSGENVSERVNARAPGVYIDDDQMVTDEGDVTFTNVNTGTTGGYVALYGTNEDGTPNYDEMVGVSDYIEAGDQTNVTARFNENYNYTAGQTYYPRLYTDDPNDQQFTYTAGGTEDMPETYGYNTTTGQPNYVGNRSTTTTAGGFTVGNTGTVGAGTGAGM